MKELLEFILRSIVAYPDEISVEEVVDENDPTFVVFNIKANSADRGTIIGKQGHTIMSIRDIVSIKAIKDNKKVRLNIVD